MKHSQTLGLLAALLLIGACFLPWIEIPNLHKTLTGINGRVNENITFGKPVILHSFFCVIAIILFWVDRVWAKRTNIFICFLNITWAIKNYILFSVCRPECPTVKIGLYAILLLAILMQIMALLPTTKVNQK